MHESPLPIAQATKKVGGRKSSSRKVTCAHPVSTTRSKASKAPAQGEVVPSAVPAAQLPPLQPPGAPAQLSEQQLPERQPGWDAAKGMECIFPADVWDKAHPLPYVHVVDTVAEAQRVMRLLATLAEQDRAAAGVRDVLGRQYWSRRVFACDTEATDIDVASECAAGHGRVTCWSVYGGPDVDFRYDDLRARDGTVPACVLYIDTYLRGDADLPHVVDIWQALRPFLEGDDFPKVWHNYGFDKHILQRDAFGIDPGALRAAGVDPAGLKLRMRGFAGDTMHMARLHDAGRKGTSTYSLASLSGDKSIMARADKSTASRSKIGLKDLFARPKVMKSGKLSASVKELPAIHEIQTSEDPVTRWKWVDYSAFDAKATWDLYHSLRERLQRTECDVDGDLAAGLCGALTPYRQWDLYLDVWRPFGELLTDMEQEGFYVDKGHLEEQDAKAQADLADAEQRFRSWLRKYAAVIAAGNEALGMSAEEVVGLINVSSSAQMQTLLFGGFESSKSVVKKLKKAEVEAGVVATSERPSVDAVRMFTAPNPAYGVVPKARKNLDFQLTCVFGAAGTRIHSRDVTMVTTAMGLPMTSAAALRMLCGKPGAAKKALAALDADSVHAASAAAAEALGDLVLGDDDGPGPPGDDDDDAAAAGAPGADAAAPDMSDAGRAAVQRDLGLGLLYSAFPDHKEGLEACAAVEALIEISAIETLRSSFLQPLQGGAVKAEDGRVHCSLNINTETGRLSCRRPNLQNQPALEKDRYFIRKAFRAQGANRLVVADYGQLELRILAHMAGCASMIDAFASGGDFHSRTAAGMFSEIQERMDRGELAVDKMDPQYHEGMPLVKDLYASERRKAKILNFSLAYGKTAFGLSKDFGVELAEAEDIVARWYRSRPEVKAWQERVKAKAEADKGLHRVQTMLGRHRSLPGYGKADKRERARASRAAINTPVQGSAADVVAAAMVRIHFDPVFKQLGWKMLLQVHDEVIMEGPEETHKEAQARLVQCMQQPFVKDRAKLHRLMASGAGTPGDLAEWDGCYHCGIRLDLTVDSDVATTWYDAK